MINGPVEFRMGSPANEPDHNRLRGAPRRVIPRRFAIADKEVTVEQYSRFVKENSQFGIADPLDRHSPDPSGPMLAVSWFARRPTATG